jgi:phosphoribosylformimino-5-aminoimidazole carboxamide ribotide isomerase
MNAATMNEEFTILPAIDIRDGHVVRLLRGDYERETRYPLLPMDAARRYADAGAQWLHLVDLDAARAGGYTLKPVVQAITAATGLRIQTGGGVRDEPGVRTILDAGADRVVVGSLAVREPAMVMGWLKRYGVDRITVALDTRRDADGEWRLPVAGWTQDSKVRLDELLQAYADAGLVHLLCTDIDRDGTLAGPNIELYRRIHDLAPHLQVQASGGIRNVDDILAARAAGCAGAVLGKALLDGRLELEEALSCEGLVPQRAPRTAPCGDGAC